MLLEMKHLGHHFPDDAREQDAADGNQTQQGGGEGCLLGELLSGRTTKPGPPSGRSRATQGCLEENSRPHSLCQALICLVITSSVRFQ